MTRLPKMKISWRRGKQYTSPVTLGGGGIMRRKKRAATHPPPWCTTARTGPSTDPHPPPSPRSPPLLTPLHPWQESPQTGRPHGPSEE